MVTRRAPETNVDPNVDLLDRGGLLDSGSLAEYLRVPIGTLDQWASRGLIFPRTRAVHSPKFPRFP